VALGKKGLAVGRLLLVLNERAAAAAARKEDVVEAAALEVVLLTDIGALHSHGDNSETDAHGTAEHQALQETAILAIFFMFPASPGLHGTGCKHTEVLTGS